MKPFISTGKSPAGQGNSAWFGVRLISISHRWITDGGDSGYAARMLNRQVDFIATLPALGEGNALELRFASQPQAEAPNRGRVDVLLRVRVDTGSETTARQAAEEAFSGMWPILVSVSDAYEWSPIETETAYHEAFFGSVPTNFAELVRREALVSLDRVDVFHTQRPIGFAKTSGNEAITENPSTTAYICFPFLRSFGTLERLFKILLMQPMPVTVSVGLAPSRMHQEELNVLLTQVEQCERYLQLPISGPVSRPSEFMPPHRTQAGKVLEMLQRASFTLRDDSLVLKIQVSSEHSISAALMEALGVAVTEHVSSTNSDADTASVPVALAGGYDWQYANLTPLRPRSQSACFHRR